MDSTPSRCKRCSATSRQGFTLCHSCAERRRAQGAERRLRLKSKGLCSCGQVSKLGCTKCVECDNRDDKARNVLYTSRKATGLCIKCGTATGTGDVLCEPCAVINRERRKIRYQGLRDKILAHYGPICACCGEDDTKVLTIDHVNNDGKAHRESIGLGNIVLVWIIKHNFPDTFQILCSNCNGAKQYHAKGQMPLWRKNKYAKGTESPSYEATAQLVDTCSV